MMISVLPTCDQSPVTEFQVEVRDSWSDRLRALSERSHALSGPLRTVPKPTMASQRTTPGATARSSTPRMAVRLSGLVL